MITWSAVYTRPQAEPIVLENLQRQGTRHISRTIALQCTPASSGSCFDRFFRDTCSPGFTGDDALVARPVRLTMFTASSVAGVNPKPVAPQIIDDFGWREAVGAFDPLGRRHIAPGRRIGSRPAGAFEDMMGRLTRAAGSGAGRGAAGDFGASGSSPIRYGGGRGRLTRTRLAAGRSGTYFRPGDSASPELR